MKNYRLKKEAVPYFKESVATQIHQLDTWNEYHVDLKALEEVEDIYIDYGQDMGNNAKTLGGWDANKGTSFRFTVFFPSVKFHEHDKFGKGKIVRDIMNKIQSQLNHYFSDFVNGEGESL